MTERVIDKQLFNDWVRNRADHMEFPSGVPMGVSDKFLFRRTAEEMVDWLMGDPSLTPEEAVLDGVVEATREFPKRYK
ncbi:hypothetical protein ACFL0Y_04030 [Patescibacteria group bacterium]